MKTKIFRQTHDFTHHDDFMKIYDRLRHFIYVRFMIKRLKIYIIHCSKCQMNQTKRHSIYDELNSIVSSTISFYTIVMNFIITLSFNRKFDVLLIIICKFSKKILLIVDHNTWNVVEWTNKIIVVLINHDWNISRITMFDRNLKFMFVFWKTIFIKIDTNILISTTWHFQTNEQSKRTNQIIEIVLRFHIIV